MSSSLVASVVAPILAVPVGLLGLWAACSYFTGRHFVENAKYRVLQRFENVELREYEPSIVAEVAVPKAVEPDFRRAQNRGFRQIAEYIFGGNVAPSGSGSDKVAMTSPVITASSGPAPGVPVAVISRGGSGGDGAEDAHLISFVMPSTYKTVAALPAPRSREVILRELPRRTELVTGRSGRYVSASERNAAEERLLRVAEKEGWRAMGAAKVYSYDPPWTLPLMMLNEVAVEVVPASESVGESIDGAGAAYHAPPLA